VVLSDHEDAGSAFRGLDAEWAVRVARDLVEISVEYRPNPLIDHLWLTEQLVLSVRYRLGSHRLAARFARLDVDPTSGEPPSNSARLASDLFHNLHTRPEPGAWTDPDGYTWWGDPPDDGWAAALAGARILSIS
jgi:hypothetical protein